MQNYQSYFSVEILLINFLVLNFRKSMSPSLVDKLLSINGIHVNIIIHSASLFIYMARYNSNLIQLVAADSYIPFLRLDFFFCILVKFFIALHRRPRRRITPLPLQIAGFFQQIKWCEWTCRDCHIQVLPNILQSTLNWHHLVP